MAGEDLRRIITYVGATGKMLRFQMRDPETGAIVDLNSGGYSVPTISARETGLTEYRIEAAALTIEAGAWGWLNFYPSSDHLVSVGDLRAQIRIENTTGPDFTDQFIIEIQDPIHYSI
jgi:hypothetical protein